VTGGLTWEADYNIVAPKRENAVDIVGWVTMDNQSGKGFKNARIKLMAGDVKQDPAMAGVADGNRQWRDGWRDRRACSRRDGKNLRRISPVHAGSFHHSGRP